MLASIGLAVFREIPVQTLAGLLTGAYTLHGGVVRDAGGRIVAHLLSSGPVDLIKQVVPGANVLSSLVGNAQFFSLARDVAEVRTMVESVMTAAIGGAALSGIGLIAGVAGTAFLSRKLDQVQTRLAHIERLLNEHHLSVLRTAVDNLRHAEHAADRDTRKAMLVAAKTDFLKSAHFYGGQFADPRGPEEVLALEDSFTLASMGAAICLSELNMYGAAAADFDGHLDRWRRLSRRHVGKFLLGDTPQRLMTDLAVDDLSTDDIVRSLDFVNGTRKSWAWVDELRREKANTRGISLPAWGGDKFMKMRIELARTLLAKDRVLDGFGEHLRFLDARRLSVSTFKEEANGELQRTGASVGCVVSTAV